MNTETVDYSITQKIPVTIKADVIVIGGGPAGIGAAVAAARAGVDTVLIERYSMPGGMASIGEVTTFVPNHVNEKSLDRGVYLDWVKQTVSYMPGEVSDPEAWNWRNRLVPKDEAALAAEDILLEAGVRLIYHHHLFDCVKQGDKIESAILFSKSGLTAAKADVFIDCSGDADLADKAGCEIEIGNSDGNCQPMTLCFKLGNIDLDEYDPHYYLELRKRLTKIYIEAKKTGIVDCPRENILIIPTHDPKVMHFNTTRVIKHSALNGLELSDAEIIARKQLRQLFNLFRAEIPEFKNARIHSMAAHIGIRESRRVVGEKYIGVETFENKIKYPDAIAKISCMIDIHSPNGEGTDIRRMPEGEWYEIPYGCIVAKGIDNLLVGGRPISVDHALHSSMRVMPPACSIGQAAGIAAAMAVQIKKLPREIDGKEINKKIFR